MLTCKEQVALSSDFIDGQLGGLQQVRVRQHLLFCPACRRFIRQMRLLSGTLKAMPETPPADLEAICARLLNAHHGAEK